MQTQKMPTTIQEAVQVFVQAVADNEAGALVLIPLTKEMNLTQQEWERIAWLRMKAQYAGRRMGRTGS